MASYILDSSALVKRYVAESGSIWVSNLSNPGSGNQIFVANIAGVEVVAALARRRTSYRSGSADFGFLIDQFRNDFKEVYKIVEVSPSIIKSAMHIAERHALRGYDCIQLSSALFISQKYAELGEKFTLVSADLELNAAAILEGVIVENPNDHP